MKNILKKLHEIMSEVDFIAKDKTNDFHKYNYASEQAIKEKLHALLVKHKVLFILSGSNIRHTGTLTDIDFTYKFFDIETGEFLEGTMTGTGEDKLDKGTYKAITGAIKYILTSTFLIPTGDDPESEPKTLKAAKAKPDYTGNQYDNREQTSATKPKVEFEAGDQLKTGEKNGKKWFGIKKKNGEMVWLKKHEYDYLSESLIEQTFSDGTPLPPEF